MNETTTWAVDISYEHESDGHNYGQGEKQNPFPFNAPRTITNQEIGENGDQCHETPFAPRNTVPIR